MYMHAFMWGFACAALQDLECTLTDEQLDARLAELQEQVRPHIVCCICTLLRCAVKTSTHG